MMLLREHFREYLREAGLLDNSDKGSDSKDGGRDRNGKEVSDDVTNAADDLISSRHVKVGTTTYEDSATVIAASTTRSDDVNWNIVLGVICAGLYPQVVRLGRFKEKAPKGSSSSSSSRHRSKAAGVQESIKLVQHDLQDVALHPSSLLAGYVRDILEEQQKKKEGEENVASDAFLVYYKKVNRDLCLS
jgi:hypothetical protein